MARHAAVAIKAASNQSGDDAWHQYHREGAEVDSKYDSHATLFSHPRDDPCRGSLGL